MADITKKRVDQFPTVTPDGTEYLLVQKQSDLSYGKTTLATASANAAPVQSVAGKTGTVTLSKADVGLLNVDNTSDVAKPVSSATQTALNLKANTASLATVATSGSYTDLSNKPTIPTLNSQLTNDSSYATTSALTTGLATKANTSHSHAESDVTGLTSDLAAKAAITYVDTQDATKQNTLVSGTNIKTVNGSSLLGSGDLTIAGGGGGTWGSITGTLSSQTDLNTALNAKAATTYVDTQDALSVHKAGTETITGLKTFSNDINFSLGNIGQYGGNFINSYNGQYSAAGFFMYSNAATMGNNAGVHMAVNVLDTGASQSNFAIDQISYTGAFVKSLASFDLNNSVFALGVNLVPNVNATRTLGTSSLYWSNLYATRHYFNSTVYLDGGTAGVINLVSTGTTGNTFAISTPTGGFGFKVLNTANDATFIVETSGTSKAALAQLYATINYGGFDYYISGTQQWRVGNNGDNDFNIYTSGSTVRALNIDSSQNTTLYGRLTAFAATTGKASLNIPSGTAPTTPNNGDIWFDGTALKIRIGGVTKTVTVT